MLVQFLLKNFLSFKEETILDLTAINAYKEHEYNLIDIGGKEKFLKVAAIYGANASGKSNLHCAFHVFRNIIIESLNNVSNDEEKVLDKYFVPFLFDHDNNNTEFEIVQILDNIEYQYGFEYNEKRIVHEWLYKKDLSKQRIQRVLIFERYNDEVEFGASIKRECIRYHDQIPVEVLFLSFFNKLKLKTDIFKRVYDGITDILVIDTNISEDTRVIELILPGVIDEEKEHLLEFLSAIDTGIKDIGYEEKDKEKIFFTVHHNAKGESFYLPLYSESEGTIKSIIIYIYAYASILKESTMFVDELNVKLHPLLLKFIIDLFHNKKAKAQLVYTTHDTTLLDKKFFRRDQIWFVQKDEQGHSELSALSDYKIRSDASFEKDYLAGFYGGIPLLKEFSLREGE